MYGNPYINGYNQQMAIDKINEQMNELNRIKQQLQQPTQQPTNLTQNFQIAPSNKEIMKYASSMEEVQRDMVIADTPYFSKDMSIVWIKNAKGEIKTYELNEIIAKDDKDIQIELLQAQINEMKGMINNAKSDDEYVDEPIKNEKSTNVSTARRSTKKSKES